MAAMSEKGKALLKWCPTDKYRDEYARIFSNKDKIKKEQPIEDINKIVNK